MNKRKNDKFDYVNYVRISLLNVVGKVYSWILIKRIKRNIDSEVGGEQYGFREKNGCVNHIFTVKQLCGKYLSILSISE